MNSKKIMEALGTFNAYDLTQKSQLGKQHRAPPLRNAVIIAIVIALGIALGIAFIVALAVANPKSGGS